MVPRLDNEMGAALARIQGLHPILKTSTRHRTKVRKRLLPWAIHRPFTHHSNSKRQLEQRTSNSFNVCWLISITAYLLDSLRLSWVLLQNRVIRPLDVSGKQITIPPRTIKSFSTTRSRYSAS